MSRERPGRLEPFLLPLTFVIGPAIAAWFSIDEVREVPADDRGLADLLVVAAWSVSLLAGVSYQAHLSRRGRLIFRSREARADNLRRVKASTSLGHVVPIVGAVLVIGALSPAGGKALFWGSIGGFMLSFVPVYLWIAVTRPWEDS